ncbi:MAG: transglutaminase domain-containing protein [Lachnospiraceae bacterium]|nr:transglutaminase domain-containing protein [Candidatus Minthocola equi]
MLLIAAALIFFFFAPPDVVKESVYTEAGEAAPPVIEFLKEYVDDTIIVTPALDSIDTSKVATYTLNIKVGRFDYESSLIVEDTTDPVATPGMLKLAYGDTCEAADFLSDIKDVSDTHAEFEIAPDYRIIGDQEISVKLIDAAGNFNIYDTMLTIYKDETAPVITGTEDINVFIGDTISYKDGVTVTDDIDPAPVLDIDNSSVDVNTPGTYEAIYTATDTAGNVTRVIRKINVAAPDPGADNTEEMLRLAAIATSEAIDGAETEYDKLYNIYWWIKNNTKYTGYSNKESAINEAISGFTTHTGDCFTYYAMLKAMMEYAGFETMSVTRINGEAQHFWCLVKYKGEWYHIDACPRSVDHMKYWYCFLRTDAEVEALNRAIGENYYYYDKTLVPASGTTIWDIDWRGTL